MNPLHLLPPETAHKVALFSVRHNLIPKAPPDIAALRTKLFGKTLLNPIGLAAGADKKAEALAGWSRMGFGFAEAGTVTRHARKGNPAPRLWRIGGGGIINWIGLSGNGLAPFAENIEKFQKSPTREKLVLGVSLATPDGILDELKEIAETCTPFADYLTLNVSCPNVAGHIPMDTTQIKTVIAAACGLPVLVKLGPAKDEAALGAAVKAIMDAGADGIVATNTVSWDNRALLARPPVWPKQLGGYSGPQLLDISCWMVERIRHHTGADTPVIGCGGIQSGADALRLFKAGANAVQIYTGLIHKGPGLLQEIKKAYSAQHPPNPPHP